MTRRHCRLHCLGFSLVLLSCQPRPVAVVEPGGDEPCIVGDHTITTDTLRISIPASITTPATVVPGTSSERLIFRQLYETLVDLDCRGRLRPGLAATWHADATMREWTFTLRIDARFGDGSSVRSIDVLDAWERVWPVLSTRIPAGEYLNYDRAVLDDVIVVRLERPDSQFPITMSRAELAVARYPVDDRGWPMGTASYVTVTRGNGNSIVLESRDHDDPVLVFVPSRSPDARDALDAGLDVVIDGTRDFVGYASRRPGYTVVPLPWHRIYGVVERGEIVRDRGWAARFTELSEVLARDVVSVDASALRCDAWFDRTHTRQGGSSGEPVVLFPRGDRTASEIAERLVAMNNGERPPGSSATWRTAGVDPSQVMRSLENARAAVVSVDSNDPWPCREADGWEAVSSVGAFVPLIRTRAHLVMRNGFVWAAVHADGMPRLFGSFRP